MTEHLAHVTHLAGDCLFGAACAHNAVNPPPVNSSAGLGLAVIVGVIALFLGGKAGSGGPKGGKWGNWGKKK
jgi:hypothetical protein